MWGPSFEGEFIGVRNCGNDTFRVASRNPGRRELLDSTTQVFDDSGRLGGYVLSHSVQDRCFEYFSALFDQKGNDFGLVSLIETQLLHCAVVGIFATH